MVSWSPHTLDWWTRRQTAPTPEYQLLPMRPVPRQEAELLVLLANGVTQYADRQTDRQMDKTFIPWWDRQTDRQTVVSSRLCVCEWVSVWAHMSSQSVSRVSYRTDLCRQWVLQRHHHRLTDDDGVVLLCVKLLSTASKEASQRALNASRHDSWSLVGCQSW